ncbi:Oidioi.mRNA.OKI2018_I69.PAR.g12070.t1.cds [Oikopleura dioica]|uniref:Oidioi.mRNA.OKI2018_I69.PAR.g12070.t1.cds n=1 Tax=Oikopleura dioica TaxID=34765 RepID=A0ABN7RZ24_OIKDI|nr:Oidioi.mRNA.OKI2018_I69.PAR.g12070.t1.cds [Oikopleura dioica]
MWLLSKNQLVRALPLFAAVDARKENWEFGEIEDTTTVAYNATKAPIPAGRFSLERFAPDDIDHFCDSIEACIAFNPPNSMNRAKCDGRVFSEEKGTISYSNYHNHAACRWEIRAPEGAKIKVKVHSGPTFGMEHHSYCGNDKLSLGYPSEDGTKKLFARICSSKNNSERPYNGLMPSFSPNGEKIQSYKFRDGIILDTNVLIVHFQSDQADKGVGFSMEYEMVNLPTQLPIIDVGDNLEEDLHGVIEALAPQLADHHEEKLAARLTKLFKRFDSRMVKCNKTQKLHEVIWQVSHEDIDKTKELWMSFFRNAFNQCDIPIINNNEDRFDGTSWPRRITTWFERLRRTLERAKAKEARLKKKAEKQG